MRLPVLVIMLCAFGLNAAEVELGKDAQKAKENYEAKVAEVISEVKEELKGEKASLIKALEKELKNVTKKGDLEGATAIQARIDELNKESNEENAGLFGSSSDKKSSTSKKGGLEIKILRAYIKPPRGMGKLIDVKDQIQGIIDSGKDTFTAKKSLKGVDIEGNATLLMEYEIDGKTYQKRQGWGFEVKLEAK